ncbi:cell wall protein IFF6-like [Mugil cephalus]|uniref:cell wall protein IFF6-like n=1 Tax=Mugil cephalus TaxID=48193 RepID=UPI001FB5E485|nr:cell wall protein IFF6-like [Mugil cephalus]
MGSSLTSTRSSCPNNFENYDGTEILKAEVAVVEVVHEISKVKVDATELDDLAGQEALNGSADSGVASSFYTYEDFAGQKEADVSICPTKLDTQLTAEMCQIPVQSPNDTKMHPDSNGSEQHLNPVEAVALVGDKDMERQEKMREEETEGPLVVPRLDVSPSLSNVSPTETNASREDTRSDIAKASSGSTDSTDVLRTEETKVTVVSGFHTNMVKVDPTELVKRLAGLVIQEASKISKSLTDSGLALSSSGPEEFLSTKEAKSPSECPDDPEMYLHSDTYLHPTEDEAAETLADTYIERQEQKEEEDISESTLTFPIIDPCSLLSDESHLELNKSMEDTDAVSGTALSSCTDSTDNHEGPNDPEMCLSPNDSDTCLSPVELKLCPSPNCEEDEEACLSLTEANTHVRPVEKYILSTRETGQWSTPSRDQASPDMAKPGEYTKVIISESQRHGLGLKLFESSEGTSVQVSSRHGGLRCGDPSRQSIIADKEEQLGFESLYWKRDKDRGSIPDDNKQQRLDFDNDVRKQTNCDRQVVNKSGSSEKEFNNSASFASSNRGTTFRSHTSNSDIGIISGNEHSATADVQGRFRRGSGEWMVYGGSLGRTSTNLTNPRSEESLSTDTLPASSHPNTGRFGSRGSGEWVLYGGNLRRKSSLDGGTSLSSKGNEESPPEGGRFSRRGSGEWLVYGVSLGSKNNLTSSDGLPNRESKEYQPTAVNLPTSPPTSGRFSSGGSGEWKAYGWSTGRSSSAGSGGSLSSGSVVRRSSSVGSGGRLSSSGSGRRLSGSHGSHRISSSGRVSSTGSGEWKPVYSSASGSKISVGSAARPSGGRTTSSQRTPSPGGRIGVSGGSGGWLSCSAAGGKRISSTGSGSRHSSTSSNERISSRSGERISSSSGSGRTNSTGGRVISSSDRTIGSTGSGAGSKKERISICKMAALSISAAGRERSQERRKQAQRSQHQQAAVSSPLVQRWLTTSVGVTSANSQGLDDIMHL